MVDEVDSEVFGLGGLGLNRVRACAAGGMRGTVEEAELVDAAVIKWWNARQLHLSLS